MVSGISSVIATADKLPPSGLNKTYEIVFCPMLPNLAGDGWGRDVKIKKLNLQEQISLLGSIRDGVTTDKKARDAGDPSVQRSDDDSAQFWESIYLLVMGCVDPFFTQEDAIQWVTLDELNGINCSDVAQFLLLHIRSLNDEQPGLEDLVGGLATIRKMPYVIQALEQAWDKDDGGKSLDLLLEGKSPSSQAEMAEHIEKWGGIISHVMLNSLRKRARVEAEISTSMLIEKLKDFLVELGQIEIVETKPT